MMNLMKIGIPDDRVVMVDDLAGVVMATDLLLQPAVEAEGSSGDSPQWVVGMDAEWRPIRGSSSSSTN